MERKTKFDMPKAVLCGLALIAAALYFGAGSIPVGASNHNNIQKIAICNENGTTCASIYKNYGMGGNRFGVTTP